VDGVSNKLAELTGTVNQIRTDVDANTNNITALTTDLEAFKTSTAADINKLKIAFNNREQQLRSATVRIFNFPHSHGESVDNFRNLTAKVFDRLIQPALAAAVEAGELARAPPQQSVIEACFRAFAPNEPAAGDPPLPVICRLSNRFYKSCVLRHKKAATAQTEAERAARSKRVVIVEDLTPPSHGLLKALQADTRVGKVWSINGQMLARPPAASRECGMCLIDSTRSSPPSPCLPASNLSNL